MSIDSFPLEQPQPDYMIVTSTTRPVQPYLGLHIFETDTKRMFYWNGTSWIHVDNMRYFGVPSTILNTPPLADTGAVPFKIQMSTHVVSTDASGYATINFPSAFPNGVVAAMIMQGDQTHVGATFCVTNTTLTGFTYRMFTAAGSAWGSSGNHRVNWIAIGW